MFYYRPPQHHVYPPHPSGAFPYVRGQDTEEYQYPIRQDAYGYNAADSSPSSSSVAFKDSPDAQQLAYQGYKEYQTK